MRYLLLPAVLLFAAPSWAQNTIPAGCIAAPFPTTPSGPIWSTQANFNTASNPQNALVTVWRKSCSSSSAVTLVTFEPLLGASPFVCSGSAAFIQNGTQYDDVFYRTNTSGLNSFCSNLLVTWTVALFEGSSGSTFNPSNPFTLVVIKSPSTNVPSARIDVGAYNAADYGGAAGPLVITGRQSGNWYNPARNGEGFMLEIGSSGTTRAIVASWYTYRNGLPLWIYGSATLAPGATSIQIPVFTTRGAQFGSAFHASDVIIDNWGTVTFSFQSCNAATAVYAQTGGETGTLQLQRILNQIDGLPCP
jgi:hypothetical protein